MKRNLRFLVVFLILSCSSDPSRYGKIKQYSAVDKKSFVFSVDEDFINSSKKSKINKDYPLMNDAEVKLIKALFVKDKYCLDKNNNPSFKISSRQEKIYDVTFAHLIEQNYNARPATPRMYFGECL